MTDDASNLAKNDDNAGIGSSNKNNTKKNKRAMDESNTNASEVSSSLSLPPTRKKLKRDRNNLSEVGSKSSEFTKTTTFKGGGGVVSKRLSKQIYACGKNYKAALDKLFTSYPFLQFPMEDSIDNETKNESPLVLNNVFQLYDAIRPICATIDILGKVNQPMLGLKLLNKIQTLLIQTIREEEVSTAPISSSRATAAETMNSIAKHTTTIDEKDSDNNSSLMQSRKVSFLNLTYKSIIGMIGQTISKQQQQQNDKKNDENVNDDDDDDKTSIVLDGEYIMQLLYYDLPKQTLQQQGQPQSPPSIDLYHNTLSALGKCKRMDLIMKLIHDMESNHTIKLNRSPIRIPYSNDDNTQQQKQKLKLSQSQLELQSTLLSLSSPSAPDSIMEYQLPKPDLQSYTTALTAAIRSKAYNESIQILQRMKRNKIYPNILAYNQVLSCISNSGSMFGNIGRHKRSDERYHLTKQILKEMENGHDDADNHSVVPSDSTYQIVMAIYAKENKWDEIKKIKLKMMMNDQIKQSPDSSNDNSSTNTNTTATTTITNTCIQGAEKKKNQTNDRRNLRRGSVESIHGRGMTMDATVFANESIILQHMNDLKKLEKMNSKRPIWYKLGAYTPHDENSTDDISFMFGLQTHRNPGENGISIVFHETETEKKLGYMLVRNTLGPNKNKNNGNAGKKNDEEDFIMYSSFMGMYIDEEQRGKKLAAKFMAIWLLICLKSNALPLTEIINKPLLSLVLTRFGFLPKDNESGFEVEVCPISNVKDKPTEKNRETGWYPDFAMYSTRPLNGMFGDRELRIQKMMITKHQPNPRGKITFVKTSFNHSLLHVVKSNGTAEAYNASKNDLIERINEVLEGNGLDCNGKVSMAVNDELLRRAVFGFLYGVKK